MPRSSQGPSDHFTGLDPDPVVAAGPHSRFRAWLAAALAVVIVGSACAVFTASSVGGNAANQSRRNLTTSSAEIGSTLQLAIQHQEDLVVSAGALVVENPQISTTGLTAWANSVDALRRYPELQSFGYIVSVPTSDLSRFAAAVTADPPGPLTSNGSFEVTPPGARPFYCLAQAQVARNGQTRQPAGVDYCATPVGAALLAARDSGQPSYFTYAVGTATWLVVETPVYRDGIVPVSVDLRRQGLLGWAALGTIPQVIADRALQGHPGLALSLRYRQGGADVVVRSGTAPHGATSIMTDLGNGWTVQTLGRIAKGGVLANGTALGMLLAEIALSVLVAALVVVLATGRARALALVHDRTEELRHQALHDALTGLPNRALITDRIEQLLARNRRNATEGAALFVDLDGFKNVNDTLGHGAGDLLLQAVAARLTTSLRDADTIGRMGGDEFVVLIDGGALHGAPEMVAERLLEVMRQPFELAASATPIVVTASVGIAAGYRDSPGELLRDADVALYQAKATGRNRSATFRAEMGSDVQHRYELELELRVALEREQFRLVYQPIYDLDDLDLIGVEALLRWDHPTHGEVKPDEFIPMLEASGQIVEVGRWVLLAACRQMRAWRDRGHPLMVSVNVSGRQLDRDAIVDHVRQALEVSGLDPVSLTIEVTETALMRNVESTARRLGELKQLGVQVAIDDFGTGYSSLAYLQRFPVDCIKIDRSFTDAITSSPESDALIRTLVQLGKDLGLKTLAEGVETTDQMDHLRSEHVNQVQGFLLARPLDPDTLETQLLAPGRTIQPTPTEPLPTSS
jgi:diguanylate cyclase (GGDEF)-like protein